MPPRQRLLCLSCKCGTRNGTNDTASDLGFPACTLIHPSYYKPLMPLTLASSELISLGLESVLYGMYSNHVAQASSLPLT